MNKRIIVFAPHPDDETCGCGGTIAKKIAENYDVIVVIMTDGRHAFSRMLGIYSDPTPEELKRIRKQEVEEAAETLGVPKENLLFLDFEDGTLQKNGMEAEEKVLQILAKNDPVEIYYPYIKDVHPDHRAANRAVRNSLKKLNLSPRGYQYSIARRFGRIGLIVDSVLNIFRRNTVRTDVSEFLKLKEAAMTKFTSEISIISKTQKKPLLPETKKILRSIETFFVDA